MPRTPAAALDTLAAFHRAAVVHDLAALVQFVTGWQPNLQCLNMTPEEWRQRDFGGLPPAYWKSRP